VGAGVGLEGGDCGGGEFLFFGEAADGGGNGVDDLPFQAVGDGENFVGREGRGGEGFERGAEEIAGGEGAGFVKGDGFAGGEGIEGNAPFQEDTLARAGAEGAEVGGGGGEDEGAGRGSDEKGEGAIDGPFSAEIGKGKEEGKGKGEEEGEADDGGGVGAAKAVEEALHAGFGVCGCCDELDNAGEGGVGIGASHFNDEGGFKVAGSGGKGVADCFGKGQAFAGEMDEVDRGAPLDDGAIEGDDFSGFDEEVSARSDFFDRLFEQGFVWGEDVGKLGGDVIEVVNGRFGFVGDEVFETMGEGEKDEEKSPFEATAEENGDESGGGHEDVDVDFEIF